MWRLMRRPSEACSTAASTKSSEDKKLTLTSTCEGQRA
eukprot:CAMPEP_0117589330 /NCGR_PEP_ID=MMETSP0784-20121206/70354_1 /TAXON_ID=39447 /ORGANISM="" /LENGTH=37 /DNA_ID= /DNA_START= /DNA_END= /DNA_ORIENTATION=